MTSPFQSANAGFMLAIALTIAPSCGGCGHESFAGRLSPATTNVKLVAVGFGLIGLEPVGAGTTTGSAAAKSAANRLRCMAKITLHANERSRPHQQSRPHHRRLARHRTRDRAADVRRRRAPRPQLQH